MSLQEQPWILGTIQEPLQEKVRRVPHEIDRAVQASSFNTLWFRQEKIIEEGRVLKRRAGTGVLYAPAAEANLPYELAKVHSGEMTPLEFARKFGLLGHFAVVPFELRKGGDPLDWFMAHARTVWTCLQLLGEIQSSSEDRLRSILCSLPSGPFAERGRIIRKGSLASRDWPKHPRAVALNMVRTLINPNLEGIGFQLCEGKKSAGCAIWLRFRALVEVIYWHLANLAVKGPGSRSVRRCTECGRFFIAEDERQRYCPHPLGKGRSRCASRHNVRLHRSKHKGRGRQPRKGRGRKPKKRARPV